MTFQQLRDWHAAQANKLNQPERALHHKAVELLDSLVDSGEPFDAPIGLDVILRQVGGL